MVALYDRAKAIVVEKLGVDEAKATADASFVDDLDADSLDLVELIMAFEEEFSADGAEISISDEDAGNITTLAQAVAYLGDHGIGDE